MKRIPILFALLVLTWSTPAFAYIFDLMCAPETDHSVSTGPPQVLFVLDQSGSMNVDCCDIDGDGIDNTRWDAATQVIDEVSLATENPGVCMAFDEPECDLVNTGLGYFSDGRTLAVEPAEDSNGPISASLALESPSGGTQIHQAAEVLRDSVALSDPSRLNVGTLISDGIPDSAVTTIDAVKVLCELRDRSPSPVLRYTVGFGTAVASGRGKRILDFLAATGGTGECCYQATYPCAQAWKVDPCTLDDLALAAAILDTGVDDSTYIYDDWNCDGSLSALDGDALKNELLQISQDAACVFPLDVPAGYPAGAGAKDDPLATSVTVEHAVFGSIQIPFCAETDIDCGLETALKNIGVQPMIAAGYKDEGWFFFDTTRQFVQVSAGLCNDISTGDVTKVVTQVACLCSREGQPCTFGFDAGLSNEQIQNARCSVGEYQCLDGSTDTCVSLLSDMPEICNGIDDDCNGVTDDMEQSWGSGAYDGSAYDIPAAWAGIACLETNSCECPNQAKDPVAGTTPATFYSSWGGACSCTNALEIDDSESPTAPAGESSAACSFSQSERHSTTLLWLLALGLLIPVGYEKLRRR